MFTRQVVGTATFKAELQPIVVCRSQRSSGIKDTVKDTQSNSAGNSKRSLRRSNSEGKHLPLQADPLKRPSTIASGSNASVAALVEDVRSIIRDRQERSLATETSSSGRTQDDTPQDNATELIFKLERRGEGWGEEILPHIVVENRPLKPNIRRRGRVLPEPWEEGSLEKFLADVGVPLARIEAVTNAAVAWRVTAGGRPLIDRRRKSRVERNMKIIAEYLEVECGIPYGPQGIGAVFNKAPQVLLCKPTTNDRWDRRVVQLAAFLHKYGHCNVPENVPEFPDLSLWVKRQRVAYAQDALTEDRLEILQSMGFEFGEAAQMTGEWERNFDQLVDWLLWNDENGQQVTWLGTDWGERGGVAARQVCLWVQLQRELRRRNLMGQEASKRLEAINMDWEPQGPPGECRWMQNFGCLLYIIQSHTPDTTSKQADKGAVRLDRAAVAGQFAVQQQQGGGTVYQQRGQGAISGLKGKVPPPARGLGRRYKMEVQLQQEIASRRIALSKARLEPGIGFWLAKQRWLWRRGKLPKEQVLLLELAGVEMDMYSMTEWRIMAHRVARFLVASHVTPPPEYLVPRSEVDDLGLSLNLPSRLPSQINPKVRVAAAAQPPAPSSKTSTTARQLPPVSGTPNRLQRFLQGVARNTGLVEDAAPNGAAEQDSASWAELPNRLQAQRWVLTQKTLWNDRRITTSQLRYMTLIGITWILSDEVLKMPQEAWDVYYQELANLVKTTGRTTIPNSHPMPLKDWLQHQKGLRALGLLEPKREAALTRLSLDWAITRSDNEQSWDQRLSDLLAFQYEFGHCMVG